MSPGINFWNLLIYCGIGRIVSSNFKALLFLQDKLLESVWKLLIPVKLSQKLLDSTFSELIQQ